MAGKISRRKVSSLPGVERSKGKKNFVSREYRDTKNTGSAPLHNRKTTNDLPLSKLVAISRAKRKPYIARPPTKMAWIDERSNNEGDGKCLGKVNSVVTTPLEERESKNNKEIEDFQQDQFFRKVNAKSKGKLDKKDPFGPCTALNLKGKHKSDENKYYFESSSARLNGLLERLRSTVD